MLNVLYSLVEKSKINHQVGSYKIFIINFWGIFTVTSQLFDVNKSCKLIPINVDYNYTHQDIFIEVQTPQLRG